MSTKAEWAELFESVHGRKPSPQEFLDAKATDFDTSALAAQAASVEAPANEPVAEEVAPEPVATEEVTEQDDIADVAETAEDASQNKQAVNHHLVQKLSQKHLCNNQHHNLIQACLKRHLSHQLKDLEQFLIQQQLAQQINLFSILSCQSLRLHFQ